MFRLSPLRPSTVVRFIRPQPPPCTHLIRSYQHESQHAPRSVARATSGDDADAGEYSGRHALMSAWHRAARQADKEIDFKWKGRDEIEAKYVVLKPDGTIERPEKRLEKQVVLDRYGLLPRDLRSIDAHILDVRPTLQVCKKSIIIVTPIIRAIIAHDDCVLIVNDSSNPISSIDGEDQLIKAIGGVLKYLEITGSALGNGKQVPFELRALEALLLVTVRGFKNVLSELQERVYATIPQLRFGVSPAELRDLMENKRTCEDAVYSARALQTALSGVLGEDEDLAAMYLTDKHNGVVRSVSDHQTAELLLEYYERRIDENAEASLRLASLLDDVDKNITLVLASTRVKLQNLELQTAIATLALAAGGTLAAIFGMNLRSGLEEHPSAFYWTTGLGTASMVALLVIGGVRLVRARRSQLFVRSTTKERPSSREGLLEEVGGGWERRAGKKVAGSASKKDGSAEAAEKKDEKKSKDEAEQDIKAADGSGQKKDGTEI